MGGKWRLWMVHTLASGDSAAKYVEVNRLYGIHSLNLSVSYCCELGHVQLVNVAKCS